MLIPRTPFSGASLLARFSKDFDKGAQSRSVGPPAKSLNDTQCRRGNDGTVPPIFSGSEVGDVHFDHWEGYSLYAIMKRNAVLGQAAGVQERSVNAIDMVVECVDQDAFVVGLLYDQLHAEFFCQLMEPRVDVIQRDFAVNLRLAPAQEVQIRAVKNQNSNFLCHESPSRTRSFLPYSRRAVAVWRAVR
jgi:hypothetical protein